MAKTWRCGDCGTEYPKTVHRCTRYFDDYLAMRGGTVESAMQRAVAHAIAPLVRQAEARLTARVRIRWVPVAPKNLVRTSHPGFPLAG